MERFRVFFAFRFPDFITTSTCVLMDNLCPCFNTIWSKWKKGKKIIWNLGSMYIIYCILVYYLKMNFSLFDKWMQPFCKLFIWRHFKRGRTFYSVKDKLEKWLQKIKFWKGPIFKRSIGPFKNWTLLKIGPFENWIS